MLKFKQIINYIEKNVTSIDKTELVHLNQALGRYLAFKIKAKINIPPKDNSAVDGYAFNYLKYKKSKNKNFAVLTEINAGDQNLTNFSKNSLLKISTGAHLPKGFDTVVMQENVVVILWARSCICSVDEQRDMYTLVDSVRPSPSQPVVAIGPMQVLPALRG